VNTVRRSLPAIALLTVIVAACQASPASSEPAPGSPDPASAAPSSVPIEPSPASVTGQHDAVIVTLSAATDRAPAGEPIRLRVDVLNAGLTPVTWQSGGCELLNGFAILAPPIVAPPAGRDWPGVAGQAKFSAVSMASGGGVEMIRDPAVPEGMAFGCTADLRYDDIQPGETISAEAIFSGRAPDGQPAAPGAYRITYAFPYLARGAAEEIGMAPPAVRPIELALPVTLEGAAFAGMPSTLAIDAALAEPRVATWIDEHLTPQRLGGAEIRLVDGAWQLTIQLIDGLSTVVTVDPATGAVTDVRLAD